MGAVLIYADTVRSPELRHEVAISVPDPFLYAECDGERHIVVGSMEIPRLAELGGLILHPYEEFGIDELRRNGTPATEVLDEIVVRAVRALGIVTAAVPPSFPLGTGDRLRAAGIELRPDAALFDGRRRAKSPAELAGMRRAQTAAEAGMEAVRSALARARPGADGTLEVDGAPLTSERIKAAVAAAFVVHGATATDFVVSHGPQTAVGHELGSGPIRAGEPVLVDLWPRDDSSGCSADMTRTFVAGAAPAEELVEWHRLCAEVLERVREAVRPGVTGRELYGIACDLFEAAGHPTQRSKQPGEVLEEGFYHSLGHGVGLEVHEAPLLGLSGGEPLVVGDVVALEPGLYRPGTGGVRLEDLVLVTADGSETLTHFPYDLIT